jgi:hypothetical protein
LWHGSKSSLAAFHSTHDMNLAAAIEPWKIFASLGVPGLALGVFYMLFRTFKFPMPAVPKNWAGPIVVLFLLLVAGLTLFALQKFAPGPSEPTFPFTVFIHGKGGSSDIVLKNSGYVALDLGGDRRTEAIGEKGQAYFPAIPATFRGQEVPIGVESNSFVLSDPKQKCRLDGSSIYLSVQRKAGHLSGWVRDEKANAIPGATIHVVGLSATTDSEGHFNVEIPGDQMQPELDLGAVASGYSSSHLKVVPNGNDVVIPLTRAP